MLPPPLPSLSNLPISHPPSNLLPNLPPSFHHNALLPLLQINLPLLPPPTSLQPNLPSLHFLQLFNPVYNFLCLHQLSNLTHLSLYLLLLLTSTSYYLINIQLFTQMSQHLFTQNLVILHLFFSQSSPSSLCSVKPSVSFAYPIPL